jgi:hypothetical protein
MVDERRYQSWTRLTLGIAIITLGILFTLDRLGYVAMGELWEYWPVLLIAIGVGRLVEPRVHRAFGFALVLIVIGVWMLLFNLGVVERHVWEFWPILLVLLGASMVWRAIGRPVRTGHDDFGIGLTGAAPDLVQPPGVNAPTPPTAASSVEGDTTVSALALLGGVQRKCMSRNFRGADLTAVMGGCELDLRDAAMAGPEAVVDTFAMWGGIDIRVPPDWAVAVQGVPILGGFADKTARPVGASRVLVVRGLAIMGGVDIKN